MPPRFPAAAALGVGCRAMADADLPFVGALYASTRSEEVAATGWPPAMQAAFLSQQHQAQHDHYRATYTNADWLILERGGAPIGRLYIAEQDGELRLIDISLLPESRGAGLGSAVLRDLLDHAAATGQIVSLHVERTNKARRLYEKLGFQTVEQMPVYLSMAWRP
jgi:ribosomal protein S18 acetylase RimI-like enzyme